MKKTYLAPQVEEIRIMAATATLQAVSENVHIDGSNIPFEGEGE
jgi:hypothetical protein